MKNKKLLVGVLLSPLIVIAIVVIVFLVANLSDADLRAEVAASLANQAPASDNEKLASKQLRELTPPSESEPKLCRSRSWCPVAEIQKKEVTDYVEKSASHLQQFQQLIALRDYQSDTAEVPMAKGIFNFLKLANLQRLEWNLRLARSPNRKTAKAIVLEMQSVNGFMINSLKNPQTLIEAQVLLLALKTNRSFLSDAAKAEPSLREILGSGEFQSVTDAVDLDFSQTASAVRDQELRAVAGLLKGPLTYDSLAMSEIDEAPKTGPSVFTKVADSSVRAGLLVNDSLNRHFEFLQAAIDRVASNSSVLEAYPRRSYTLYPRNFIGRNILAALGMSVEENFVRMKQTIETLRQPLVFEAAK